LTRASEREGGPSKVCSIVGLEPCVCFRVPLLDCDHIHQDEVSLQMDTKRENMRREEGEEEQHCTVVRSLCNGLIFSRACIYHQPPIEQKVPDRKYIIFEYFVDHNI
jgi:hypothetical protein